MNTACVLVSHYYCGSKGV